MNLEEFREFCLSLPQASEHAPWSDKQYKNLLTFNVADNFTESAKREPSRMVSRLLLE